MGMSSHRPQAFDRGISHEDFLGFVGSLDDRAIAQLERDLAAFRRTEEIGPALERALAAVGIGSVETLLAA